jgi:phosphopantothenoylcysteine synthetase/decarboxylase
MKMKNILIGVTGSIAAYKAADKGAGCLWSNSV